MTPADRSSAPVARLPARTLRPPARPAQPPAPPAGPPAPHAQPASLAAAGCWRLTLTWSGHADTLDLSYEP